MECETKERPGLSAVLDVKSKLEQIVKDRALRF